MFLDLHLITYQSNLDVRIVTPNHYFPSTKYLKAAPLEEMFTRPKKGKGENVVYYIQPRDCSLKPN